MILGTHAGYILGAYAFTALVIGGLILHAVRDHRAQKRALAGLQDAGGERA
ncbi:heme exporter protein CcmD [Methylobacterium sp. J-068]|uniref:heme exporter protein CcmD n=1 Tax=Methylobacterium sp. J-068 TaxID=2836649 RepID=UPI001FB95828|nr:heme exporter protein CcmD [Methylobacterium sp. J-068]MCJ2034485.1 heme exporter protein CcmD [Methylobacterium sp. J-068]